MGQDAIGYQVKRLQSAFKQAMDQALEPHDLSASTYAVLHHLHFVGVMSSSDLARASWVTPQTMHRLAPALKKRGFIKVHGTEGRTTLLDLTPSGRAAFQAALTDVSAIETRMLRDLTPTQTNTLRELLLKCIDGVLDDPGAPSS